VSQIAAVVVRSFEVDLESATKDVEAFLERFDQAVCRNPA
jgi:hypothetical protein